MGCGVESFTLPDRLSEAAVTVDPAFWVTVPFALLFLAVAIFRLPVTFSVPVELTVRVLLNSPLPPTDTLPEIFISAAFPLALPMATVPP